MKRLAVLLLLMSPILGAWAQNSPIFLKVRTDATIDIRKHATGADLVEITMRDPTYPLDLLRAQVGKICAGLGTPARGLVVGKVALDGVDSRFQFVKATFATNGIILSGGRLRIQPILQAFAGAPDPFTIQGLTIDFEGVSPTAATVQRYGRPGVVEAEARATTAGPLKGIEYRVAILSQDPSKMSFPNEYTPDKITPASVPKPSPKTFGMPILVMFIGAGVGVGALVYFAMLRSGSKSRP